VSKHWKPEHPPARARENEPSKSWPEGATAGLLLVAAICAGVAYAFYQAAGPNDVFAP
jgi:hypothetical protein